MQIILLDKVVNLGNLGEVVKVKDGYARNFLIPSGRARRATESAIKEFEVRRAELEKAASAKLAAPKPKAKSSVVPPLSSAKKQAWTVVCSVRLPTSTLPKS